MASTNTNILAIRLGPWINWQKGAIFGSQVTLSSANGQVLSSFLGIFVTVIGVQLWQIISFTIPQCRSRNAHSDGLHHQLQVVLRNTSSPWAAAKSFVYQLWAWRRYAAKSLERTLPWVLLAVVYALAFAVLSILAASAIVKAPGNARVIRSNNCGFFSEAATDYASTNQWRLDQLQDATTAAQYAHSCYPGNVTASTVTCDLYAAPFLPFTTKHVGCPFEPLECNAKSGTPYQMDTGLLDSHTHFGINVPKQWRLQYRKVTTCSTIGTRAYAELYNVTNDDSPYGGVPGDTIVIVNMGSTPNTNYTYYYNSHRPLDDVEYTLETALSNGGQPTRGAWNPVPALNRSDADVALVAMSINSMGFLEPCDDPFFSAHHFRPTTFEGGEQTGFWQADYGVNSLACAEQYQYCNPNNGKCTDLTSGYYAGRQVFGTGITDAQGSTALRLSSASMYSSVVQAIQDRGANALRAQASVSGTDQYPLPSNQWEIEVEGWFASGLARMQSGVQAYASRSSTDHLIPIVENNTVGRRMCDNQITLNTQGTVSFSLLGLGIILCLGTLVILLGFTIEPLTTLVQQRSGKGLQRCRDWALDDKLQLHRMALEARGVGPWRSRGSTVPVTEKGAMFAGWQRADLENDAVIPTTTVLTQQDEYATAQESKPFIEDNVDSSHHRVPKVRIEEYHARPSPEEIRTR